VNDLVEPDKVWIKGADDDYDDLFYDDDDEDDEEGSGAKC
jgi:hypothetical protein